MPSQLCEICGGSGTDYKFSYSADRYLPERCRTCRGSGFQAKCNDCGQVHSRRQACEYKYWPQVTRSNPSNYCQCYQNNPEEPEDEYPDDCSVEQMEQAVDLCRNSSLSYEEIAEKVGVPVGIVQRWCAEAIAGTKKNKNITGIRPIVRPSKLLGHNSRAASEGRRRGRPRVSRLVHQMDYVTNTNNKLVDQIIILRRKQGMSFAEIARKVGLADPDGEGAQAVELLCKHFKGPTPEEG